MRALTVFLTPPSSHPAKRLFDESGAFDREKIYNFNLLEDGTMVLLGRIRADLDVARDLIETRLDVLDLSISGDGDGSGLVYVHTRPPPAIKQFIELPREHEVFFDFPIEGTSDGRLRVVMIGETNEILQEALAAAPPELDATVERIGPYPESSPEVAATLTDRQRGVLDVALALGYYDVPRRATHADIAQEVGLSVATVSEHLQKVEARVFGTLFD